MTRQHEGTGLGLALVRQFAEAMGGQVAVQSQLGQGATFTVRLEAAAEVAPLKVLVGSDSSGPRERLLRLLSEAGHQARGLDAGSVVAALEQDRPDVLVLDLATPALGLALVQRLRDRTSPVLVLLAPEASEEETRRLRELGAEVGWQNAPKSELLGTLERLTSGSIPQRAA
jgi:CheY-like chemotaxis protein